jgi:hypothetical protein
MREIEKMVGDTGRLVPENFNILSFGLAIDASKLDTDIALSGLASINGIDVQKIKSVLGFLKTQKQSYIDKMYSIESFSFGDEGSIGVLTENEDGTAVLATTNSAIIEFKVPDGWDGRRALVMWFVKKDEKDAENWKRWFLPTLQGGDGDPVTRSLGLSVFQNQSNIRLNIQFERSSSGKFLFPGLDVFVKYYRGSL